MEFENVQNVIVDYDGKITEKFTDGYYSDDYSNSTWEVYINSLNLGILYYYEYARTKGVNAYIVVDEKKWALTRLKYGI